MTSTSGQRGIDPGDNYIWLLVALLILFFASALFDQLGIRALARTMGGLITFVILVAVWSMEQGRSLFFSRIGITVVLAAIVAGEFILGYYGLALVQLGLLFLFTLMTIVISCRQVLFSGHVDGNKIIGAICIYLFMGLAWSLGFLIVEELFPGSIPALEPGDWRSNMQEATYFSFVTMTTLGFGDISPVQPLARFLTYLEAITGQFYIAILVATLIGVRLTERQESGEL